VRWRFFLHLMK